jgi:hypothetical protein
MVSASAVKSVLPAFRHVPGEHSSAFTSLPMLFLMRGLGPFLTLPLGSDHVDDLAPAGDKIGKLLGGLVGQRPGCDAGRFAEVGNHTGIDRVSLGALADGLPDLFRIGDCDRQGCRK